MKARKEITEKEALHKAARYCASAEHCISEVTEKLNNWGVSSESIESIIEYLLKEKYIDESRYCQAFIKDKLYNNKWGRIKISYLLYHKHIPADIIDKYMAEVDIDKYEEILKKLLISRKATIKGADAYELKNKLIRFAQSRGFEMEYINPALKLLTDAE